MNPWRSLPYVLRNGKPDLSSYEGFSMTDFIKGMDSPWKKKEGITGPFTTST